MKWCNAWWKVIPTWGSVTNNKHVCWVGGFLDWDVLPLGAVCRSNLLFQFSSTEELILFDDFTNWLWKWTSWQLYLYHRNGSGSPCRWLGDWRCEVFHGQGSPFEELGQGSQGASTGRLPKDFWLKGVTFERESPVMTSSFTWHHFSWCRALRDITSSTSPDMKRSWSKRFLSDLNDIKNTSGPRSASLAQLITAPTPKSVCARSANLKKSLFLLSLSLSLVHIQ